MLPASDPKKSQLPIVHEIIQTLVTGIGPVGLRVNKIELHIKFAKNVSGGSRIS